MTDQSHNNRRATEPGHRYAPRQAGVSQDGGTRRTEVVRPEASPRPSVSSAAQARPARERAVSSAKPAKPRPHRSLVLKRKGLGAPKVAAAPVVASASGSVAPATPPTSQKRRYSRFHPANAHPVLVFMGAAVLAAVLVFGGGMLLFRAKKDAPDKYTLGSSSETLGATTSQPNKTADVNEIAPTSDEMAAYRTAPSSPRYLKIPKMQVNARVIGMDAGRNGLPAVPQNIYDAGWLTSSAKPGDKDVVLINGQVVGTTKSGVFDVLDSLAVGDVIQLERGDGRTLSYKVSKIDAYDPTQITPEIALAPADTRKPGLNLLAANGRYNVKTNAFEKRLIIRTVQQ